MVFPAVTSPAATLKTVWRRDLESDLGEVYGVEEVVGSGGGGTEKRARSWASVSRMSVVISGVERRALVKILGGGKLSGVSCVVWGCGGRERGVRESRNCVGRELDLFEVTMEERHFDNCLWLVEL